MINSCHLVEVREMRCVDAMNAREGGEGDGDSCGRDNSG